MVPTTMTTMVPSVPTFSLMLPKPLLSIIAAPPPHPFFAAIAAETIGKDAECNDMSNLCVWDGLLANCPHLCVGELLLGLGRGRRAGCVSSQDNTPRIFTEPWDYSDDMPLIPSFSSFSRKKADKDSKYYVN